MSPSPPGEAQHYRGSMLTPESPRPVHIPEPSSIPVLQNQIDPIFNLMSTHMETPHPSRDLTAMDHEMKNNTYSTITPAVAPVVESNEDDVDDTRTEDLYGSARSEEGDNMSWDINTINSREKQSVSSLIQNHTSLLADQHSTSMASFDPLRASTQTTPEPVSSSTLPSKDTSQNLADFYEPSQFTPTFNGHHEPSGNDASNETTPNTGGNGDETVADGGVNYQTLLDNISPSSTAVSPTNDFPIFSPDIPADQANTPTPASANFPSLSAPAPAGLPPRPPPQEKPAIHPNYIPGEDIRSYHNPHFHHAGVHTNHPSQPSNSYRPSQGYAPSIPAPGTAVVQTGLPPPPVATFQQPPRPGEQVQRNPITQQNRQKDTAGRNGNRNSTANDTNDGEGQWNPEIQRMYEQFLSDERVYTSEGTWDRFPPGSRLFVGNLPSEVVSKRDIFQIFYRYGKLAQVSIKQAYGFVQFLDASACHSAMQGEQGMRIKDRNMHLEISKPQKNSRNAVSTTAGDNLRASHYRRSRSPDHGRRLQNHGVGPRPGADRFVPASDFRDEPRRRDDYRPGRSPSPRGYRGRDEYRGVRARSPDRYYGGRRSRSRSPLGKIPRYRSPSPRVRDIDDEATLPIPRREPRDVPDVQIILVDELDRAFVAYLENTFRERGLRCAVLLLPRVSLAAVVKRQILEGVLAIVKLYRSAQLTGKIPLQLFDRSGGADNVRFEEYDDLEARVAAELVIRAKSTQMVAATVPAQYTGPPQAYPAPQYAQPIPQQLVQQQAAQPAAQPNIANLITSLDGPALQKLLGAMQQNPQASQSAQRTMSQQSPIQNQNLASILGNAGMQQLSQHQAPTPQGYSYPQQQVQQQPQQQYPYGTPYHPPPQQGAASQQQQSQHEPQHVQNIMEQLARWRQ